MSDGVWGRVREFEERFARAQATEVVEWGWGYAVVQAEFWASWHHNRVVVTGEVERGWFGGLLTRCWVAGGLGIGWCSSSGTR
ncbi:hypothetical protein LV79_000009 [Actinokineospora globicatena]|nr:hypothetical protein [Actinokineospora globicatena]GLW80861.1 hypothetical protein Aglo01_53420 [Actinokineospora globicatena]GLW88054.1 hypothetical protein Aglo02_56930 [Actinokineospora globicatena]